MRVINKVEVTEEELVIIKRVQSLDCSEVCNCKLCPLYMKDCDMCIKVLATKTLTKLLNARV